MQRLEVSGVVQLIYRSLGVKGLKPMSLKLIYRYIVYKCVWEEIKCMFVLSYLFLMNSI